MGTISEYIYMINADELPSDAEWNKHFSFISKTSQIKQERKEYQKRIALKPVETEQMSLL